MSKKAEFIFYLAAVICFGLAAAGDRLARRGAASRITSRIGLLPLGLLLWLFPLMWNTGKVAF